MVDWEANRVEVGPEPAAVITRRKKKVEEREGKLVGLFRKESDDPFYGSTEGLRTNRLVQAVVARPARVGRRKRLGEKEPPSL